MAGPRHGPRIALLFFLVASPLLAADTGGAPSADLEPYARALTAQAEPCTPDIDGNGRLDALTDGLLAGRYLLGLRGNALVQDAIGSGATRSTAPAVEAFLGQADCRAMLDVDGNGAAVAAQDGLLFLRYLFGMSGASLTQGAVASGAARVTADSIGSWISYYANPRYVVAEGRATTGREVTDRFLDLRIRATSSTPVDARVVEGRDQDGNVVFGFELSGGTAEVEFPDPNRDAIAGTSSTLAADPEAETRSAIIRNRWDSGWGLYLGGDGIPTNRFTGRVFPRNRLFFCYSKIAYELHSACGENDNSCLRGRDPVLFVHGYTPDVPILGGLGGGEGTWKDFPDLLWEQGFVPFEFRWRTSTRFQEPELELASAIRKISDTTGRKVHLVGHSFGGVLLRALMQGYGTTSPLAAVNDRIASVVTLGAPSTGIADDLGTYHGVDLPNGQDSLLFEGCQQTSCHQMGEPVFGADLAPTFGVSADPGELPASLAQNIGRLPNVPILTLIGLATNYVEILGGIYAFTGRGDGLVTGWGQRFHPLLSVERDGDDLSHIWSDLLVDRPVGASRVTEKVLGFEEPVIPRNPSPNFAESGYRHSTGLISYFGYPAEPYVEKDGNGNPKGNHDGYVETLAWLRGHPAAASPLSSPQNLDLRVINVFGQAVSGASVRLVRGNVLLAETTSTGSGAARLSFPFIPNQDLTVYVNAPGYRAALLNTKTFALPGETQTQLGEAVLLPSEPVYGDLALSVVDALNGSPISGANLEITRIDHVTPDYRGSSSAVGVFGVTSMAAARYRVGVTRSGYVTATAEVFVYPNTTNSRVVALSPNLPATGNLRVILTWGASPSDLDSHLVKKRGDGTQEYHIYWSNRSGTGGDFLDRDDTTSFGPETTTVQRVDPTATYTFSVYQYSSGGSLTSSNARVLVILADGSQRLFEVPTAGSERWWKVFDVVGGTIRPCTSGCLLNQLPGSAISSLATEEIK